MIVGHDKLEVNHSFILLLHAAKNKKNLFMFIKNLVCFLCHISLLFCVGVGHEFDGREVSDNNRYSFFCISIRLTDEGHDDNQGDKNLGAHFSHILYSWLLIFFCIR
ncbi:hypothetical protein FCM35_KLT06578 [Carex littledalei]|uniref:Uncharacterized protein n=1 Tax=Carex littledalei TaxID=544730 RepID=A0A833V7U6_9POAL|nr:hypothetical protein FCM35_KLT06578 [Carex littledalei]